MPHSDTVIVADFEAGIGTLTRLHEGSVDSTLVIVEPTPRSIDVGQRAALVAAERQQGHRTVVANKIAGDEDDARIRAAFDGHKIISIPVDPVVITADRQGASPIDVGPDAPAVQAISEIAQHLAGSPIVDPEQA